jgi:hypothetical protein
LAKLAAFRPQAPIVGPGECGIVDPVLLDAVILPDQARVAVVPPASLRCTMAEAVAVWLREDVAPAALTLGASLRALDDFDSYECRSRNRVDGAKLSEHGRGNALDVRGFLLAGGTTIVLADAGVAREWRQGLRQSACTRFSTVLGPGSDGYHEQHIHLDLAERRGGYKICSWDVRTPEEQARFEEEKARALAAKTADSVPLPRPRPEAAKEVAGLPSRKTRSPTRTP